MTLRHYQPGDEEVQARIYNEAAGGLPGFKPASPEEVARRYRTVDPDPSSKFYAIEDGEVVGYAVLNPNGRISYPWCLAGREDVRAPLLDAVLSELGRRGCGEAWAAYRADWEPILAFLRQQGFAVAREMINYVVAVDRLPRDPPPEGHRIETLQREDVTRVWTLDCDLFQGDGPEDLARAIFENPYVDPTGLVGLVRDEDGELLGAALAVVRTGYADPTKIDAAMPCFRLGAMGTEGERHKRVNGLVSVVFSTLQAGEALLAEAARRFQRAGLAHAAAQAPSDRAKLCDFYGRYFQRQGSFPILTRRLTTPASDEANDVAD